MFRLIGALLTCLGGVLLAGSSVPANSGAIGAQTTAAASVAPRIEPLPTIPAPPPGPPPPPTPQEALDKGVLIVVSLPSQRMVVFKDGELWRSSPVSTGKRGHSTPPGVFPILQKRVRHYSNLYGGAPMPYMQRLTWDGVALHAGHLPGRAASHGCIRLPWKIARELYSITGFSSTIVLVTAQRVPSPDAALALVSGRADGPRLARTDPVQRVLAADGPRQIIQLGASNDASAAAGLWAELVERRPQLSHLEHRVVAATVAGRQVFRLRATGPGAHSVCTSLARQGVACLKVRAAG